MSGLAPHEWTPPTPIWAASRWSSVRSPVHERAVMGCNVVKGMEQNECAREGAEREIEQLECVM